MESCMYMSLNFVNDSSSMYDYKSILELENLVDLDPNHHFSKIVAPVDWYQYSEDLSLFEILADKIPDSIVRGVIIQKMLKLFNSRVDHTTSNTEVTEKLLTDYDSDFYYSIISNNEVKEKLKNCTIISSTENYQETHEKYLSIAPSSNEDYALRCKSIFDKISFPRDFIKSLSTLGAGSGINGFSIPVTKALSIINKIDGKDRNIRSVMHWVTENCGFQCTVQGSNKSHLTTNVTLNDGTELQINCEFHIKISENNQRDGKNYYTRIYFGLMPQGQSQVAHILHCGEHL